MTRIVINRCFGGFALSPAATARYRELGGAGNTSCDGRDLARHDPILVRVVEELGNKANGPYSELEVVEIEGTLYRVTAYDGRETIQTPGDIKWMDAAPPRPSMQALARELGIEIPPGSKGFNITSANGNTVSVQWGSNNSCQNRGPYQESYPVGYDCEDAEIAIWNGHRGKPDDWHWFRGGCVKHRVPPEQVREWIKWAAANEIVPRPKLPDWGELEDLVKACQGEIGDEYRASEDEEDDQPGMQLTVGWDGKRSWSYQTGDNSFTGGAYSYPHWAVISVYRDSDAEDLASDIRDQLEELNAGA